uniref:DUF6598 domain-containing protein n=1 Tax=Oryza punctata TaxID=4537 RepID=A0A0E0LUC6_ORYPU
MRRLFASFSPHLLSFEKSSTPRWWWPSALARRVHCLDSAANRPTCPPFSRIFHGSRNMASSSVVVKGEELGKPERRPLNPSSKDFIISLGKHSAISQGTKNIKKNNIDTTNKFITRCSGNGAEDGRTSSGNVISGHEGACRTTFGVIDSKAGTTGEIVDVTGCELSSGDKESLAAGIPELPVYPIDDDVPPMEILPNSSHRDGSIYKGTDCWKREYYIANRNETRLEAMMFSNPTDCIIRSNGICMSHGTCHMLQLFSLRLAKIPVDHGLVELYGYIAVRDRLEPLLNYFVNFSRDDPIIVEQGSLIHMAGPKRGIQLIGTNLIEYDMKIKTGQHEEEDLQLIDGVSIIDDMDTWNCNPFICRIHGDCGAIDIAAVRLNDAVEATIEVAISQVQSSFAMHLGCFTSGLHKEIQLFDGAIGEFRGLKKHVVAVVMGAQMDLKFKVATDSCIPVEHCCSFKANKHGCATQEIKTDFALITVNVAWSTIC